MPKRFPKAALVLHIYISGRWVYVSVDQCAHRRAKYKSTKTTKPKKKKKKKTKWIVTAVTAATETLILAYCFGF